MKNLVRIPSLRISANRSLPFVILIISILSFSGCTPRVEVAAPDKPITINLNVKIDHEVKVKVEKDLEDVISKDSPLF
ncbi:MAG: YnbE family lipoprotein [Bdellovibrionales bacterium]|nr:YnbE family lipoprotein [Bdellovibrionales bacterium]